jgi:hypothetical protein
MTTRRDFLKQAGLCAGAATLGLLSCMAADAEAGAPERSSP